MKDSGAGLASHGSILGRFDVPPAEGGSMTLAESASSPTPAPQNWLTLARGVKPQTHQKVLALWMPSLAQT